MRGGFNHLNIAMAMKEHTICWWSESGFNHLDFWIPSWDGCGFWRRIFHEYFTQPWLSVGLTVVKELLILMWSASFVVVVSNPIWRIRVWGECLIHKYVGLLKGGYLTNTGLSLLDVSRGMVWLLALNVCHISTINVILAETGWDLWVREANPLCDLLVPLSWEILLNPGK